MKNKRQFNKEQIFKILSSTDKQINIAKKYNVDPTVINKIVLGINYKKEYEEYLNLLKSKKIHKNVYYYYNQDLNILEISFEDLLFTICLTTKNIVLSFNTIIRGELIQYEKLIFLLIRHML